MIHGAATASPQRHRHAILSMAVATVFFFLMSAAVKACGDLHTLQIVFFRALIAAALCGAQLAAMRVSPLGTHRRLLFLRGLFGTLALCCYFWSLAHLPIATATVLQGAAPIFTAALGALWLGAALRPLHVACFALAAAGVALVERADPNVPVAGVSIALLGAAMSAVAYATIGRIGEREHPLVIVLWFPLVTLPLVGPLLPWVWVWPSASEWLALLAVGVTVQIAQVAMTTAYQIGPPGPVALTSYLGVVWAALGGWWWFGEAITPLAAVGMALVVGSVMITARTRP